ncbi:mitochondrial ribosomal protein S25-domain-containing protein [Phakopsora pachyrhizi]|uniref:Small ribosomal subunit protein mS23 n=1 Tax=Phakopsora pachyrhizi TaxID=170000 RepID=A0AAV0B5D9_PHAPC|nr:mitochondrial ribosomal protein S25-domain-containing protein [Phakopsora pachyrhizi]CAH7681273.1 mitochondrial ribosomal protein S25-domain-containing protein [Phakopsora pachyrhizi]
MVRNHPVLVHKQLSEQLRFGFIKQPPPAYSALMNHPPNPTPTLQPSNNNRQSSIDLPYRDPRAKLKVPKGLSPRLKPIKISYDLKDRLRRAFFRDHPIEAYRSKSLLEVDLIDELNRSDRVKMILNDDTLSNDQFVGLDEWTRLSQRTIFPDPEDCIDFAYALHVHNPSKFTLNIAYSISVSQFRTLRFEEQIRSSFARQESEYYSMPISPSGINKTSTDCWGRDLLKREDKIFKEFISDMSGFNPASTKTINFNQTSSSSKSADKSSSQNDLLSYGILRDSNDYFSSPKHDDPDNKFQSGKTVFDQIKKKSKRLNQL